MSDSGVQCSENQTLKDLDNILKCGICYEYFSTTLITPCSHNYCSYCIRQSLLYRNQCPSCFEETNESQLRPNRVVDNILTIYIKIKDKLSKNCVDLAVVNNAVTPVFVKDEVANSGNTNCSNYELVTSSLKVANMNVVKAPSPNSVPRETPSSSKKEMRIPTMFSPKKNNTSKANEKKVSCPVCFVEIPERNINIHLDACLKGDQEKSMPSTEKRKLLPKLVYHLLSDKELRKKLSDIGLSTLGDHKTLVSRHKRYTLLYNSECDAVKPRSIADIIQQLKKEEEDEKKASAPNVKKLNVDRKSDPRVNEEAQRQYLLEHKVSFQKLIEAAGRSRNMKKNVDHLEPSKDEPNIIAVDDDSSDVSVSSDFNLKRPSHKRKLITSDSDHDSDCDDFEGKNRSYHVVVEANVHIQKTPLKVNTLSNTSNKENESAVNSKINFISNSASPDIYNDGTAGVSDSETDETPNRIFEEVAKKNRKLKENLKSPKVKAGCSSSSFITSPVLSSKLKTNRTPKQMILDTGQEKRNLSADLLLNEVSPSSSIGLKSTAGQCLEEDLVDSDSSSNHSASLMMYTGPDCETQSDNGTPTKSPVKTPVITPVVTPVKVSPIKSSKSKLQMNNFDLGIVDILQNSEEFEPLAVRRKSKRLKHNVKITPPSRNTVVRKRVKIDDL